MRPFVLSLLLSGSLIAAEPATTNASPTLDSFTKNLQSQLPNTPNEGYRGNVVGQFKQLQSAIDRGDYDRAQMLLQNLTTYTGSLPPDLQEQWSTLADQLAEQIELSRQQAAQTWKTAVDQLAKSVREACLAAQNSEDLDPQLVRCAALQMRRVNQDNILTQRANQKLQAIAQTLDVWARFLDAKNAGNGDAANNALRQLRDSNSGVTILSAKDLAPFARTITRPPENIEALITPALADVSGAKDLPAALEKLRKLDPAGLPDTRYFSLPSQIEQIEILLSASEAVDAGNWEKASLILQKTATGNLTGVVSNIIGVVSDELNARIAFAQLVAAVKKAPAPDETGPAYLKRITTELVAAKDYPAVSVVMETVSGLPRATARNGTALIPTPWRPADPAALRAFVLAQRYETAGDFFSAMMQYRTAMSLGQGSSIVPVDEAQAALKRLNEAHPEIQKDSSNAILQQLQLIQEQLRSIPGMRMMPPYPPGYPR